MWNSTLVRLLGVLIAVALVTAACGNTADTATDSVTEDSAMESMDDTAMDDMDMDMDMEDGDGHDHDHSTGLEVDPDLPIPSVAVEATPTDTPGTFILSVALENFTPTPENIDAEPIDNEGHMHYLIDGVRIDRFTDLEVEIQVPAGEHLVEVELNSNDHQAYMVDGEPIRAGVTLTGAGDAPEADVVLSAAFVDGEVQLDGSDRFEVANGDLVMVTVSSDTVEEVHVHGYDLFSDVGPDEDAMIMFTANIAGRFEIEFEQSGVFIAELVVS